MILYTVGTLVSLGRRVHTDAHMVLVWTLVISNDVGLLPAAAAAAAAAAAVPVQARRWSLTNCHIYLD